MFKNEEHKNFISQYKKAKLNDIYLTNNAKEIIWPIKMKDSIRDPYFILFCSFRYKLPSLSKGALKLYLFIGLNADYKKGYLISSAKQISKEMDASLKSVHKWTKELEEQKLILTRDQYMYFPLPVDSVESNNMTNTIFNMDVHTNNLPIKGKTYTQYYLIPYDFLSEDPYHKDQSIEDLSKHYRKWLRQNKENKVPYHTLKASFREYLYGSHKLSSTGTRVYIYCILAANPNTGYFKYKLPTIAKALNIKTRALSYALNELENKGLIVRHQLQFNGAACTHIVPL